MIRPSLDLGSSFLPFVIGVTNQHLQPNTRRWERSGDGPIHGSCGVIFSDIGRDKTRFRMLTAADIASVENFSFSSAVCSSDRTQSIRVLFIRSETSFCCGVAGYHVLANVFELV